MNLPRRWALENDSPTSAAAISPGWWGRHTYVSPSSTATILRPSACSSARRARSASGSSGIVADDSQADPGGQGRGADGKRPRARLRLRLETRQHAAGASVGPLLLQVIVRAADRLVVFPAARA